MRVTANPSIDKAPLEDQPRFISIVLEQIIAALNSGLDFSTNFAGNTVSVVFASASAEQAISHNLGREPVGYIPVGLTTAMTVYNGSSANTAKVIYLQSSAVGTATLFIF